MYTVPWESTKSMVAVALSPRLEALKKPGLLWSTGRVPLIELTVIFWDSVPAFPLEAGAKLSDSIGIQPTWSFSVHRPDMGAYRI
jgi:hypothetical protein